MPDEKRTLPKVPKTAGAPMPWEPSGKPKTFKRAGFVIDLRRCVGCHACSVSCKTEHDVSLGVFRTRVRYVEPPGNKQIRFVPMLCMHCQDAPCIPACPTESISKIEDGRVVINKDTCDTQTACIGACPYDAISLDPHTQLADKCDFCQHRTEAGMDPACVASCPSETLRFGDLDDPNDPVAKLAKLHGARPMRDEAETKPSVLYIDFDAEVEKALTGGIQLSSEEDEIIYVQE